MDVRCTKCARRLSNRSSDRSRNSAVFAASACGQTECSPRVEAGVRGQQPAEVVPGRSGSGNGIKRREKGAVLPETAQKACYKLPTGFTACAPSSKTCPPNCWILFGETLCPTDS